MLALLGAALGSAVASAAIIAWAPTSIGGTFAHVPWADVLLTLAGLPVAAGVAGWLFAGRQPRSSRASRWSKRAAQPPGNRRIRNAAKPNDHQAVV